METHRRRRTSERPTVLDTLRHLIGHDALMMFQDMVLDVDIDTPVMGV